MKPATTRDRWLLLLLGLVVVGAGLGLRDPWPSDEPRFALVAREMVETGDWLFPHRAGELYPDKPPLFMWLMAIAYSATGSMRVSFLLPSLAASLGTLLLVHDLARRIWGRRVAWFAALALLCTAQFFFQAKRANIDATLAFWTTLGLYGLMRHLVRGPAWGWYAVGWAAAGFGIITKGVGFLPALVLVPYVLGRAGGWRRLAPVKAASWRWLLGPAMLMLAVCVWLVPMLAAVAASGDPELAAYRDNILLRQTVTRYAEPWHHHHWFGYYLVNVIPVFWIPLSLLLPWAVPAWWRRLRRGDGVQLLLLGWVALVVVFFSLSSAKRGVYLLPALPATALAMAPLLPGLVRRRDVRNVAVAVLLGLGAIFPAAAAAAGWFAQERLATIRERYAFDPRPLLALLGAVNLAWGLSAWRGRVLRPHVAIAGMLVSVAVLWGIVGYPVLNPVRSAGPFMERVESRIPADAELALLGWREQFVLHASRPVVTFGYERSPEEELEEATRWLGEKPNRWVLLPRVLLEGHFALDRARPVGWRHRREWYLASAEALEEPRPPIP